MLDNKTKKFLEKYTLTELKGEFLLKKDMLYKKDFSNGIFKAFCFERSGFDKNGFYLWVFAQPLYIPSDFIFLTFGMRLRNQENNEWWESKASDPNGAEAYFLSLHDTIVNKGIPYLNQVSTPEAFCHFFKVKKDKGIRVHEGVAYSLFYLGDKEAYNEGRLFLNQVRQTQNCEIEWVKEMISRTELLLNSDLDKAKEILTEWEKSTIGNLKL